MSLKMQLEKKKALDEMRRLMAERKKKDTKQSKIDNPLAKYNSSGQLTCALCCSVVKSENVWKVHINSKQHRENVEKAKKLKEMTNNFTEVTFKRPTSSSINGPPEKKIKGILKNAHETIPTAENKSKNDAPIIISHHDEEIKRKPLNTEVVEAHNASSLAVSEPSTSSGSEIDPKQVVPEPPIPEGFFDDPILDAKVRNIEYKDPVEEEWEKFKKAIKEEASASAEIIAGEQEEATAERQIDEIDEQMRNWSRVLELELKKEETKKKGNETEQMSEDDNDESENETDLDEFLDWRAKKSYS